MFIVIKPLTIVDGLYFNKELTEVLICFVIGNTINKTSEFTK